MEESIANHGVAISRIEDCEDDMQICKGDVDQSKILLGLIQRDVQMLESSMGLLQEQLSSTQRDVCMLEASMESAHKQLENLGDWMDGCIAETC